MPLINILSINDYVKCNFIKKSVNYYTIVNCKIFLLNLYVIISDYIYRLNIESNYELIFLQLVANANNLTVLF